MHIAVEGCAHGELDIIYRTLERLEQIHRLKIDLLLCCGDFQSVRNEQDLKCMAVPLKYMQMQDFHQYYSGEKKAPFLTIFIGGGHEASNYLQELPYGGWVAPNIYYLGYASVINVGGLRIGGLSGIYKGSDYSKGHYEKTTYNASSIRSVYHVRNLEVFRLKQLSNHMDIFLSHDWPRGIYHHGNKKNLVNWKPHFREEIASNTLGSRPAEELIGKLRPDYWFSGHLHVKFAAVLRHEDQIKNKPKITKFLALDKCLPRREFLQLLSLPIEGNDKRPLEISHDPEWLTVLRLTNHLLSTSSHTVYMPGPGSNERYSFVPSQADIDETLKKLGGSWVIPQSNFVQTAKVFVSKGALDMSYVELPQPLLNPQTKNLCVKLGIDDPVDLLLGTSNASKPNMSSSLCDSASSFNESYISNLSTNQEEIDVSEMYNDDDDDSGISKLGISRDEASGDFILEVTQSPAAKIKDKDTLVDISPIRGAEFSTPKRQALFGPVSSSPRYPASLMTQNKKLSLSKPTHTNETTTSELVVANGNQKESSSLSLIPVPETTLANEELPLPIRKDELSTSKINDGFISLTVDNNSKIVKKENVSDVTDNMASIGPYKVTTEAAGIISLQDDVESKVENSFVLDVEGSFTDKDRSPTIKRECSFSNPSTTPHSSGDITSNSKKFKRRNASLYSSADDV